MPTTNNNDSKTDEELPSEQITANLEKLSVCAAILNQILLHSNANDLLSGTERKYCVEINVFLHDSLAAGEHKYSGFDEALDLVMEDLTKLAIIQQNRLCEISEVIARAATEEISQRLRELLQLQNEVIRAAANSAVNQTQFIRLMQLMNDALINGDFVFRNFNEVLTDMRKFAVACKANKAKPEATIDLFEECCDLIQQIVFASGANQSLSKKEKSFCEYTNKYLQHAFETYEYKKINFAKTLPEIFVKLTNIAAAQQIRLASKAEDTAKNLMTEVIHKMNALVSLQKKVRSAESTINKNLYIRLLQKINDALLQGNYAHPNFGKALSKLQTTFRCTKPSVTFEGNYLKAQPSFNVFKKHNNIFSKIRASHKRSKNRPKFT